MGKETRTLIAIDVGTTQVRAVAARPLPGDEVEIVAFGQAPSAGLKRGLIEDVDEASYAVRAALEDGGLERRIRGAEVYAGISGKHIASFDHVGETPLHRSDGLVTDRDLAQAIDAVRAVAVPQDRLLLHVVPKGFLVDGYRCRRNPVGMQGKTAHADAHVVTAELEAAQRLSRAVQMAGKDVDWILSNAVAASQAVLRPEEKELGAVMLDIGGGTTDIVAYSESGIYHTSALPLGGNQLANDIAIALNTSFQVGQGILHEHGAGDPHGVDLKEEITVPCFGMSGYRRFRHQYLYDVIRLRLTEILQLALARTRQAGKPSKPAAGLVITGGVANLPGIERLAQDATGFSARVALAPAQGATPDGLQNPAFAAVTGTLQIEADAAFAPVGPRGEEDRGWLKLIPPAFTVPWRSRRHVPRAAGNAAMAAARSGD